MKEFVLTPQYMIQWHCNECDSFTWEVNSEMIDVHLWWDHIYLSKINGRTNLKDSCNLRYNGKTWRWKYIWGRSDMVEQRWLTSQTNISNPNPSPLMDIIFLCYLIELAHLHYVRDDGIMRNGHRLGFTGRTRWESQQGKLCLSFARRKLPFDICDGFLKRRCDKRRDVWFNLRARWRYWEVKNVRGWNRVLGLLSGIDSCSLCSWVGDNKFGVRAIKLVYCFANIVGCINRDWESDAYPILRR